MSRVRRLSAAALLAAVTALALAALAPVAGAQGTLQTRIREAALDPDGFVRLIVSVTGPEKELSAGDFVVTEEGEAVRIESVRRLLESRTIPVAVALVVDVSNSTRGKPLADAKAAAKSFVAGLPETVRVAVVGFGSNAVLRQGFTTNRGALNTAIDRLSTAGETALYDGVVLASTTLSRTSAQHNVVVFSDGKDTASRATLQQAIAAAKGASAPVTTVGLVTGDFDQASLQSLAEQTRGRVLRVGQSAALAGAFRDIAREIASQYVLTYHAPRLEPAELDLAVSVNVDGATARDSIVVLNGRERDAVTGRADVGEPAQPLVGFFAKRVGLWIGLGATFLGTVLFITVLMGGPAAVQARLRLRRGLRLYGRKEKKQAEPGIQAFGRAAGQAVERLPRARGYEDRLQVMIERAGWPLRSTELIAIQIGGVILGAVIGFLILDRIIFGAALAAFGGLAPWILLSQRVAARQAAFLSQLPDSLQLLSGSLQAGYGFLQALDTLVKESHPPTSTEFGRVLTEARLGMPVNDALMAMADRSGSEDFRWVVLAINIQRQVGGNLAELLTTISNTLREREQVRRQIKVLSAEGRLSAVILVVLPFGIAGYILTVNPGYLQPLFEETFGKILVAVGITLIAAGIVWMRKIIRIDV